MIPSWASLNESERQRVLVARAFLASRLSERGTLDWALRLEPHRYAERFTIDDLLNGRPVPTIQEPYATAWRLIEESWVHLGTDRRPSFAVHNIRKRLREGERSAALVSEIANLLAPRLEVKPLEDRPWGPVKRRHPRRPDDLLAASLTSVSIHRDFGSRGKEIGLAEVCDVTFLTAVASALMAAVDRGLHVAYRIYGEDDSLWGHAAKPARVYFVHLRHGTNGQAGAGGEGNEPDAFNRGIAPSIKFLHAAVLRIADLDPRAAMPFLLGWRFSDFSIHRRLWAAGARDARLASAKDVADFLAELDESQYWDLNSFPEVAELRALRFRDLHPDDQSATVRRLRRGPPRKYWPRDAEADSVKTVRRYVSALELRRIEVSGGNLPTRLRGWLLEALAEFPDLEDISIEHGFTDTSVRYIRGPSPGPAVRFDHLDGEARLCALEGALSGGRLHWEDSAGSQASAWIQNPEQADQLLSDLESCVGAPEEYPHVLDCFGWFHTPPLPHHHGGPPRNASNEAERVLGLMAEMSEATLVTAIGGICHWLHAWCRHALRSESGGDLWLRAWPIAVDATNAAHESQDNDEIAEFFRSPGSDDRIADIDTLNTPSGKLVRAFLETFLPVDETEQIFVDGHIGSEMLGRIMEAADHSGLIGRCLLMQNLSSLLQANPEWTKRNLLPSLSGDDVQSILLWRAIASHRLDTHTLTVIGEDLLKNARDARLGETARESLISSVVFEDLHALREKRDAAVPCARLSQMLRFADEEIRTYTARAVRIYQDKAPEQAERPRSAAEVFRSAVRPFLQQAWPQERSLGSPRVSQELSGIPAVSGDAFVETVEKIERFLTPFDCWSMLDYGFYDNGETSDEMTPQLATMIDDEPKGHALLRLLDRTIGDAQNAVVPHDLSLALERIETVAPKLAKDPAFRRLSAAARR